jgi:hypothetical protein
MHDSTRWTRSVGLAALALAWVACGDKDASKPDSASTDASTARANSAAPASSAASSAAPSASAAASATAPSAPKVASKPAVVRDITARAVVDVSASSAQGCHQPGAAFDSWPTTSWTEDNAGDGTGEWIEARVAEGTWVEHLEIGGGWFGKASSDVVDLWEHNNSFRKMKVTWDGGEATLEFNRLADRGRRKRVPIGKAISSFRITAEAVDKGRFNDLCVDDVYVFGGMATPAPSSPDEACLDASPAECADGLFMKYPGVALPRVARETVDKLAADRALFGVQMLSDRKAGPGILVRNACQAAKVKALLPDAGDAACQPLEPATYLHVVTAKNACDRYAACTCGLAYGLDDDAATLAACAEARALVAGHDNASCDTGLTNLKELLNRIRTIKPDLRIPCECQN